MGGSRWLARFAPVLVALLTVGGCGGGGDGDGPQPAAITAGNAAVVRDNALRSVSAMSDVADLGERILHMLPSTDFLGRTAARGVGVRVPGVCSDGNGTVDVSVHGVTVLGLLPSWDGMTVTFDSCALGNGHDPSTFNGSVSFSIAPGAAPFTGIPTSGFEAKFLLGFSSFTASDSGGTTSIGGDFGFTMSSRDGVTVVTELSGTSRTRSEGGGTTILSNFWFIATSNETSGDYSRETSGRITSSDFGSTFLDFETTTPFAGTDPGHPDQGVLVVSGGGGSSLTVTVLSSSTLEVSLDANGDGASDQGYPVEVSWDELDL